MRWLGNLCGDERTVKKFALFPIEANGEWRLLLFIKHGMVDGGTMIGLKIRR